MNKVDIVLATYNGEKFIAQQLDSIISQTYSNWKLIISDDGSTDNTISIIENYINSDERIILVNKTRQGGVVPNFSRALEFVTSNYIMFSDQDDYWLPEKIEHLKGILENKESLIGNIPLLVFSDFTVTSENLTVLIQNFYVGKGLNPECNLDPRFLSWRSTLFGCTVMFNKSLYKIAFPFKHESVVMHDQWFALEASLSGCVLYAKKSLVYHRQHDNNVVGSKVKTFAERLKGSLVSVSKIMDAAYGTNRMTIELYGVEERLLANKLRFVRVNILPFFHMARIYSLFFIFFYICSRN